MMGLLYLLNLMEHLCLQRLCQRGCYRCLQKQRLPSYVKLDTALCYMLHVNLRCCLYSGYIGPYVRRSFVRRHRYELNGTIVFATFVSKGVSLITSLRFPVGA